MTVVGGLLFVNFPTPLFVPSFFHAMENLDYFHWIWSSVAGTVIQSLSRVQLFATPWTAACQAPLSSTVSQSLLRLISTESVMLSNHLKLCYILLLLPSIFPSIRVFSSESAFHIRWPKELQHQSFQWISRVDFLWGWLVWSPCSLRDKHNLKAKK